MQWARTGRLALGYSTRLHTVNVYADLSDDDSAFEAMPTAPTQRLDDAQRTVLRGIGESTKALHCTWWMIWREPESRIWRDALSTAVGRCATTVGVYCAWRSALAPCGRSSWSHYCRTRSLCLNYYAALLSPSICTLLRRSIFGLFLCSLSRLASSSVVLK